jgi:hypothetical protein
VIRNVVVHIINEQPLLADLYDVPSASDAGLLCTNLRSMDGKRPVFIDRIENTFFFPYRAIRFLEITSGALERHRAESGAGAPAVSAAPDSAAPGVPVGAAPEEGQPGSTLPAVIEVGAGDQGQDLDLGEEIDEDFLRRIRDI